MSEYRCHWWVANATNRCCVICIQRSKSRGALKSSATYLRCVVRLGDLTVAIGNKIKDGETPGFLAISIYIVPSDDN